MHFARSYQKTIGLCLVLIFILGACAKKSQDDIIATVNNQPIYAKELQRQVALKVKIDPSFKLTPQALEDELNILIDRKLLIQEAMQKGLSQEERFTNTIKSFWEQTLIRDLMDYKKDQFQDYVFVTDDEVKDYYKKLMFRVKFRVIEGKEKTEIDGLLKKVLRKEEVEWQKTIGPVAYEDLGQGVLQEAFNLSTAQVQIFFDKEEQTYYLVQIQEKELVAIPDLKDIYDEVKARLIEHKYTLLFTDWLSQLRKKAKIKKDIPLVLKEVK